MPRVEMKTLIERRKLRYWLDGKVLQGEATHFDNVRSTISESRGTYELWIVDRDPLILELSNINDQQIETMVEMSEQTANTLRREGIIFDRTVDAVQVPEKVQGHMGEQVPSLGN